MPINSAIARTTSLLSSDLLLKSLQSTQRQLLDASQQISTGKSFDRASDEPSKVSAVLYLQQTLDRRGQQKTNLQHASSLLDTADQALADATDIVNDAKSVASSQIGVGSDADTRETEAAVVDAQLDGLLNIANRQYNQLSLFGGNNGAAPGGLVFQSFQGGIRYTGAAENLQGDLGALNTEAITSNGVDAFGALSARVKSQVDLDPQATDDTRLADTRGAQGEGVRKGSVQVIVDGSATAVDLTDADTLGDVATRINQALGGDGSLSVTGDGFTLTSTGASLQLRDTGEGQTAGDLGLRITQPGAGAAAGFDVAPKLTPTTRLADLGASIDFASGFTITQGAKAVDIDTSAAQTVEDLQNLIKEQGLGLRLDINDDATGLDLVSEVAGLELTVGENGGTTASDLGIRSFDRSTALSDFRHGQGVERIQGEDDLKLTLRDGTGFSVNLDGLSNVGEVVDAIESQAAAAGVAVGTDFSVGLATNGNGLALTDNTAGAGSLVIENASTSHAADHLGIAGSSEGGATLVGQDTAKVRVDNVFSHLINLRDALLDDDTAGITLAGSKLEDDTDQVIAARARVGVQAKRVIDQQTRVEDQEIQEQTVLSQLQDADLTEVITRYQQLQTQLQASLSVGAQLQQLSLLDFLR